MVPYSNADLRLHKELLPVSPVLDLSFQFVISHLLTFGCYPHLINPFPLPRSIPLSLTAPSFSNSQLICGDRSSDCRRTPNLEGQSTVFKTPGAGWPSCTPHAPGTHFSRLFRPACPAVGLLFSKITARGLLNVHTVSKDTSTKQLCYLDEICTYCNASFCV